MRTVGFPSVERIEEAASAMASGELRSHLKKRTDGGAGGCEHLFDVSSSLKKQKHTFIRQVLNVEDCNLDSLLGQ
jgi:hypothetical protein